MAVISQADFLGKVSVDNEEIQGKPQLFFFTKKSYNTFFRWLRKLESLESGVCVNVTVSPRPLKISYVLSMRVWQQQSLKILSVLAILLSRGIWAE